MPGRDRLWALLLVSLVLPFVGCGSSTEIDSITISPTTVTLGPGATVQLTAIGTITHGSHPSSQEDITNKVNWASSIVGVASVSSTGLVTGQNAGLTSITASIQGFNGIIVSNVASITVPSPTGPLVSMTIDPTTQTASAVGQTAQFIAIGSLSSGATVNLTNSSVWTSSDTSVATINASTGLATAVGNGTATITAVATNPDGSIVSGTAKYTVTTTGSVEPLASLAIVPTSQTASAVGQTAQYIAIGTTSSGTTVNLTNQSANINGSTIKAATWTSSNASTATINAATGLATATGAGATAITAIATNPDGTVVTATASYTVTIPTSPEPLVSLAIVPATQTASAMGQTAQFVAIGTTSSGTTVNLTNQPATIGTATIKAAVWGSSSPSVATINAATGVATATGGGASVITALAYNPDGSVVTGTATYTVTIATSGAEPLVSLAIVPATQTATASGQTAQYLAIGTTASGETVNLTSQAATINGATIKPVLWGSTITSVATIGANTGLATAVGAGATAITAIASNPDGSVITATGSLTVNVSSAPEPLVSLAILPSSQTATTVGQTVDYIAIGTTADGTTVNLTDQSATVKGATIPAAVWSSSNPAIATINSSTGQATSVAAGVTAITAIATNPDGTVVTGAATYTVTAPSTPEPLVSLAIVPAAQTASAAGQTAQYIAIGTTASGTTVNLTNQSATIGTSTIKPAVWSSSSVDVATINPATGLATAVATGATAITAIATNPDGTVVTGSATYTVTVGTLQEPLVSLTILPSSQTASTVGETAQFTVIGVTSSGTTVNLTNQPATINGATIAAATWTSSIPAVATINSTTGLATALTNGTTAITAFATNPDGTVVTGVGTYTVSTSGVQEPLLSLAILPSNQSIAIPGQKAQLHAIGTFSVVPTTQDLTANNTTYPIRWTSSDASIATVGSPEQVGTTPGLVTAIGQGSVTITAFASNPDGTLVYSSATVTVIGAASEPFTAITISPTSMTLSATGQTGQFVALGTSGSTGLNQDVTNSPQVVWTSSIPTIATVSTYPTSPAGLAKGVNPGTTTITATLTNPDGTVVTSEATVTVTTQAAPEPLISLQVYPTSASVDQLQDTTQFVAIGTFSTNPTVQDLTNSSTLTWISTEPSIFPVNSTGVPGSPAGIVTALGPGTAVIIAEATNPDGSVATATATFSCPEVPPDPPFVSGTCYPGSQTPSLLATLTIFNAGLDSTNWLITAPSATGTADVIHCGPGSAAAGFGGSVCEASYPIGTTVTVTAPAGTGNFGGWTSNCTEVGITQQGPNSCTVVLSTNDTVGGIFN
jgi:uncharacterized protein YjdB